MRKSLSVTAVGLLASLSLVACGGGGGSSTTTAATPSTTSTAGGGGPSSTIKLAASPSQIAYTTDSLSAKAGNVTIDLNNPNGSIPHDVCVQSPSGQQLGCADPVTGGSTSLSLSGLKSGKYTFYCNVDSHEAAGMKGTLTVK